MTDKRKINVKVAGMVFPLWVSKENQVEEENLRAAAKNINDSFYQYKKIFPVKTNEELLLMTTLQFATGSLKLEKDLEMEETNDVLQNLISEIDSFYDKE